MDKEHTEYLFKEYPKLFPEKDRDSLHQSLMAFGFDCGDGWFNIIDMLCKSIQEYTVDKKLQPVVTQVKEKFGGLRFYISSGDDHIFNMISKVEDLSYETCEECGRINTAKLREDRLWIRTLCDECSDNRESKVEKFKSKHGEDSDSSSE